MGDVVTEAAELLKFEFVQLVCARPCLDINKGREAELVDGDIFIVVIVVREREDGKVLMTEFGLGRNSYRSTSN